MQGSNDGGGRAPSLIEIIVVVSCLGIILVLAFGYTG